MVAALERDAAEPIEAEASAQPSAFLRHRSDLYRFGSAAVAIGAVQSPIALYLPNYYGAYVGMPIGQIALAFLIVRLFDISFDPLTGVLLDRTRTRFGQARPWLIVGTILVTLASPWLFLAPKGAGMLHLILGLLVIYAGVSMANLAQAAWSARLITDYTERSRLWGWIQVSGSIGIFLLFAAPLVFAGSGDARHGDIKTGDDVRMMGSILTVAVPIIVAFALFRIPEPPVPVSAKHDERVRFADYVQLLRIPNVRRIVITDAVLTFASGITAVLFFFFWSYARGYKAKETTMVILAYMVAVFIGTPFWVRIARKTGKKAALIASLLCYPVIIPAVALFPRNHMDLVVPGQFLLGLSYGSALFLLRSMAADTADEIRLKLGKDCTGQLFALFGSTAKLGTAISAGCTLLLLQVAGFDAKLGTANTPGAIFAVEVLYVAGPGLFAVAGALLLAGYKLNRSEHERILLELSTRAPASGTGSTA